MVGSRDRVIENVCLEKKTNFEISPFQCISFIRLKRFKVQNNQRTCRENFKCRLERSDSKELSLQTFLKVGELCISSCYKHILEEKTERQIHASTDCSIDSQLLSLRIKIKN